MNLVSGFSAIIFASRGDVVSASWLIAAAMVFDYLDGFFARLLKAYSDVGKELDSLADVVSFGVAPAMILFHFMGTAVSGNPSMEDTDNRLKFILMFLPAIMPVCAALRLAIFNIDPAQTVNFRGLPTPANAIAVITVVFALDRSAPGFLKSFIQSPLLLLAFILILSLLMVIRLPLLSMKIKSLRFKGNEGRYMVVVPAIVCLVLWGAVVLPFIIPLYIVASILHFRLFDRELQVANPRGTSSHKASGRK